jgi:hypothetical protein
VNPRACVDSLMKEEILALRTQAIHIVARHRPLLFPTLYRAVYIQVCALCVYAETRKVLTLRISPDNVVTFVRNTPETTM